MAKINELTEEAKIHLDTDEDTQHPHSVAVVKGQIQSVVQLEASLFSMGGIPIEMPKRIGEGIFIATSKRIILYRRKTFGGYELKVFFYSTISSIEMSEEWKGGQHYVRCV